MFSSQLPAFLVKSRVNKEVVLELSFKWQMQTWKSGNDGAVSSGQKAGMKEEK